MLKEKEILSFADMLSKTLGEIAQITVSYNKKYLYINNPIDEMFKVGNKISDDEMFFLENEQMQRLPFIVNYKSLSPNMQKLRSSTFFFKDDKNKIEYMLSISFIVDKFIDVRSFVEYFINGSPSINNTKHNIDSIPKINTVDVHVEKLIENVIIEGEKKHGTTVKRMTKFEKQSLIREMHSRGIFLIKGSVAIAAEKLLYSETTIYRYIKKLE
ncbi:MAG: hypothetical protein GYA87_02900 [Christensenellaceae bacterium]|nr:hypothetical protein [Christensenellaceae bacterium]